MVTVKRSHAGATTTTDAHHVIQTEFLRNDLIQLEPLFDTDLKSTKTGGGSQRKLVKKSFLGGSVRWPLRRKSKYIEKSACELIRQYDKNSTLVLPDEIIRYIAEMDPKLAKKFIQAGIYVSPETTLKTQDHVSSFLSAVYESYTDLQYIHTVRIELSDVRETEKALQTMNRRIEQEPSCCSLGNCLPALTTLRVRHVCVKQLKIFLKVSGCFKSLTTLDLAENKIGSHGLRSLVEELVKFGSLTTLNLAGNDITSGGLRCLQRLPSLTELNLKNNDDIDRCPQSLNEAFAPLQSLTTLNLAGSKIGKHGLPSLAHLKSLTELNLQDNIIFRNCHQPLNETFSQLKYLKKLNLDDNWIGPAGFQSLRHLHMLTELTLRNNWLSLNGSEDLDAVLDELTSLTKVDLEGNMLGRSGARGLRSLMEAFDKLTSLTIVSLKMNDIHDDGAQYLVQMLPRCMSLKKLDLRWNQFDRQHYKGLIVEACCDRCDVLLH